MQTELLLFLLVAVATLLLLDAASLRWGADSRPGVGDDHRR